MNHFVSLFTAVLVAGLLYAAPARAQADDNSLDALVRAGQEHSSEGRHAAAVTTFERAATLAAGAGSEGGGAAIAAQLGGAYLRAGRLDVARTTLTQALAWARERHDSALIAAVLNDTGMLHQAESDAAGAIELFLESAQLARAVAQHELAVSATLNAAVSAMDLKQFNRALALAVEANKQIAKVASETARLPGQLRAGLVLLRLAGTDPSIHDRAVREAHAPLQAAFDVARRTRDPALVSAAAGALGTVYLEGRRYPEALTLTEQAIAQAQQHRAPALLFQWHWQAGRIHRAQGRGDHAIRAYRQALAAYEETAFVRTPPELTLLPAPDTQAAFLELADMLLVGSDAIGDARQRRAVLFEARDLVERYKARELQDYFRDNCVAEARARVRTLESSLDTGTAVLYPIVFADRIELLVSNGIDIERIANKVRATQVLDAARQLRDELQSQRTRGYLPHAHALYRWLLMPVEPTLQRWGIKTLITVPDPALRTIPFAALHDGKQFVVERYALATVPGMQLIDPRPLPVHEGKALLSGVSVSVQGYPALGHVDTELRQLHQSLGGTVLRNELFTRERLERELTDPRYTIAHIASHGEFSGDVRDSFVLTHDGKVQVDQLARYIGANRRHDNPLDLLTLSACQTAAGDARAALGLAGITVKAGTRSALASLWAIHDEATSLLMDEFYRQLKAPGTSKAAALQRAQQKLTGITRYRHPGYWSAFVLIGSWQ